MIQYQNYYFLLGVALRNLQAIDIKAKSKEIDVEQNLRDVISALRALSGLVSERNAQK
jgi:hypothetical protein